ncbi:hypothetical protein HK096_005327, partial [Nowakowskiella sp. JEL0078]
MSSGLLGIILIFMNIGRDLITASIIYIYPTLQSLEAVESMKKVEDELLGYDGILYLTGVSKNISVSFDSLLLLIQ